VGGVVLDEDDSPDDERSYTDVFIECAPYYMSLGMTWEEYWNGDNILPQIYRKKADLERDRRNIEDWRLGRYIMHAIGANMSEKNEYPDEPFPLTDEQAKQQAERQREQAYDDMLARFNAST
jgi:hypothetical protein